MEQILGKEKAEFVLRILAYAMLGQANEQLLFLWVGKGRNGKSSLANIMRSLFGAYGIVVEPSTFLQKTGSGVSNDLARMRGTRAAFTSEVSQGARLDAALVKKLTGQERISARFLFREYFEFTPQAVFFMSTNYLPIVDGSDDAMARRMCVIPFDYTVPAGEVDQRLGEKLEAEKSGILNRLLVALGDYRSAGLGIPPGIKEATRIFLEQSDLIGMFLSDCCKTGIELKIEAGKLYNAYHSFCFEQSLKHLSLPSFRKAVERKGFKQKREKSGNVWIGLGLKSNASRE